MKQNRKLYRAPRILEVLLVVAGCVAMACTAMDSAGTAQSALRPFCGEWDCRETAVENTEYYTGYMELYVQEDGTFSIYDAEAGNPGIEGTMQIESENTLTLHCDDSEEFEPPATWENMQKTQQIAYQFVDDNTLELIYKDDQQKSTLVFDRDNK